ncbi:MAG: uncharacterized membrane protein YkvA (DUF1232 family) [Bacteroidia bacterium]
MILGFLNVLHDMSEKDEPRGFDKAKRKATKLVENSNKLKKLIDRSLKKASLNNSSIKGFVGDLNKLIRMISAYAKKDYREFSMITLVYIVGAIVYFVNPFDVIPDFLFGFGFIDDATVVAFVIKKIHTELTKFTLWEANNLLKE